MCCGHVLRAALKSDNPFAWRDERPNVDFDYSMKLPHLLRPSPLRKRLWQLATLLAIVTVIFAGANLFLPDSKAVNHRMLGHDFLAFYTAGSFVADGRAADLYDLPKVAAFEDKIARQENLDLTIDYDGRKFGPWWNPPFYAWAFVPLAMLPYPVALAMWTLMNLAALAGAIYLLMRMLVPQWLEHDALGRIVDWRTTGLVPFLLLLSMPFVQAISHGQNTLISLCLLSVVVTFWRNKRAILAGAFCALLGYKPQLAAVVAAGLVLSLGLRALIGMGLVGSVLVLVTQYSLPGVLVHYLRVMPANLRFMQIEHDYLWERHATLKAFWRLLLQGRHAGEMGWVTDILYAISLAVIAAVLIRAVISHLGQGVGDDCWSRFTQKSWRDRLIAATICCAPLLMPFYFDYDLLLLSIPATLLAAEVLARPIDHERTNQEKWLARSWIALYAWMLINPGMANLTHVNLTVVLLTAVAIQMTLRATRPIDPERPQVTLPFHLLSRRAA